MGEVAERLDVRTGRAYELAREGRLPGVVRLGRQIRVDPAALDAFIAEGGTGEPGA
jgi:excisionase family DNA binding protein